MVHGLKRICAGGGTFPWRKSGVGAEWTTAGAAYPSRAFMAVSGRCGLLLKRKVPGEGAGPPPERTGSAHVRPC